MNICKQRRNIGVRICESNQYAFRYFMIAYQCLINAYHISDLMQYRRRMMVPVNHLAVWRSGQSLASRTWPQHASACLHMPQPDVLQRALNRDES